MGLATAVGEAMAKNSVSKHSSTIRGDESNFCINPENAFQNKCEVSYELLVQDVSNSVESVLKVG
jgi:hypothetical protein